VYAVFFFSFFLDYRVKKFLTFIRKNKTPSKNVRSFQPSHAFPNLDLYKKVRKKQTKHPWRKNTLLRKKKGHPECVSFFVFCRVLRFLSPCLFPPSSLVLSRRNPPSLYAVVGTGSKGPTEKLLRKRKSRGAGLLLFCIKFNRRR